MLNHHHQIQPLRGWVSLLAAGAFLALPLVGAAEDTSHEGHASVHKTSMGHATPEWAE